MVDVELKIYREWVPVSEDVFDDAFVCSSGHGAESVAIFDLINIGPGREVYICFLFEAVALSVDDHADISLDYDDHQVVLRPARPGVYDMVFALDFAGEDIVVDIPDSFSGFFSEKDGWFGRFMLGSFHFFQIDCQMYEF